MQHASSLRDDRRRRRRRAHDEREAERVQRPLAVIGVEHRAGRRVEAAFAHIGHDADDCEHAEIAVHAPEFDPEADRILIRPACPRERFADDRHVRRAGTIAILEQAAAQKRDAHCAEVARARHAKLRPPGPRRLLLERAKFRKPPCLKASVVGGDDDE